jgi:hypothetical protein
MNVVQHRQPRDLTELSLSEVAHHMRGSNFGVVEMRESAMTSKSSVAQVHLPVHNVTSVPHVDASSHSHPVSLHRRTQPDVIRRVILPTHLKEYDQTLHF